MIKTKVVATVGPACEAEDKLGAMIDAGVNVFRLNFSHGTLEGHATALERIRRLAAGRNAVVAVMGDLCGPKIRVGKIAGGRCVLAAGHEVIFQRGAIEGTATRMSSNYPALIDDAWEGHRLLIDDGNVLLRVKHKRADELVCGCEIGGVVSDHKGINLPDSDVSAPALTDKDRADLLWAIEHELDLVALSFVRRADDVGQLRHILDEHGADIRVVSKIEKPEALEHLDAIVDQSDVVLVARGDLGVEMDVSRVPILQKEIALLCRRTGVPVIVATQMLQSMVNAPVPTRAEVCDVANAILDHADAVMLSAETSVGRYPLEAVQMIGRIAAQTEAFGQRYRDALGTHLGTALPVASAVVRGASLVADELDTRLVAVWTEHGDTPRLLSKQRLSQPVVALAPNERVCRQMSVLYGVIPVQLAQADSVPQMIADVECLLLERGLAEPGDRMVMTADVQRDVHQETDALLIHTLGSARGG